jgi:urease accessory protein UreF
VHRGMTSRLLQLPDKHSVTALLNTWAQSIHQACLSAASLGTVRTTSSLVGLWTPPRIGRF